jgi:hypothetical protein
MSQALEINNVEVDKDFVICPILNKEALKTQRVFITDESKKNSVYIKSKNMFVESVENKVIRCRMIDDDTKSFVDELDYFVLSKFNSHKQTFLPAMVGTGNVRNYIDFTRENGSYLNLIVTEKLNIFDENDQKITDLSKLLHRIIRVVFSPIVVDVDPTTHKFSVKFYGFTIAVMNSEVPEYILQELRTENVPFMGVTPKPVVPTTPVVNFDKNPFK